MLKSIVAIIVSYVIGNLVFFGIITACFFLLGVERVFVTYTDPPIAP